MSEEKSSHPVRQLRNLFITGLLVVVPLGTTVWIIYKLFDLADRKIRELLRPHFRTLCEELFNRSVEIPPYGVGLVVTLLVILAAGLLARNLIGRRLISLLEKLMSRVPVARQIYLAVKQISEAVFQRKRGVFEQVVLIEYPRRGLYSLGFVTSEAPVSFAQIDQDLVCVFVSTTPNPTSGVLVFAPRRDIITLKIPVEEGMKMVISAGVVIPKKLEDVASVQTGDVARAALPTQTESAPSSPVQD